MESAVQLDLKTSEGNALQESPFCLKTKTEPVPETVQSMNNKDVEKTFWNHDTFKKHDSLDFPNKFKGLI
jgi:hypothetical protein